MAEHEGKVLRFPDLGKGIEAPKPVFRKTVPLQVPHTFDVSQVVVRILPSVDDAQYMFHVPQNPDTEEPPTRGDFLRELRAGNEVSFGIIDQNVGDSVNILFVGPVGDDEEEHVGFDSSTYRFTEELGWKRVKGSLIFAANNGSGLDDIEVTEEP